MKQIPLTLRRWSRAEYDRLVELGVLHGEPVELVGGQLVVAEPQGSYHASVLGAAGGAHRGERSPAVAIRRPVGSKPRRNVPPRVTTSAMRVAALPKLASVRKQTPLSFLAAHDV